VADDSERPIIKKVKKVQAAGAHGGAWKVAYADFATAMMAFFMLMWLLNVAPPETLQGIANYFKPTATPIQGGDPSPFFEPDVGKATQEIIVSDPKDGGPESAEGSNSSETDEDDQAQEMENQALDNLEAQIQLALQKSQEIKALADQIQFEKTEDGLKIRIIDRDQRPMFRPGTAELYGYARTIMAEIGTQIEAMPNRVAIYGHTDSTPFSGSPDRSNWELSGERANAVRRVLRARGIEDNRVFEIVGKASTEPLFIDNPARSENRRVTILVLREVPVLPGPIVDGY